MVVTPVYVFVPESVKVPAPFFSIPPVPDITPVEIAVGLAPPIDNVKDCKSILPV